ncbi:MAG TPA: hypothetical protein DCP37_00665 [Dehalococcoidia bacterium]|nr:hypothetical protein [SAR202 cluster bacterium]MQG58101.1 glycoside hydrolase family 32 protein [SAR202 cluster bacterium]HAL46247.1 hypothetical protein [Dehalococcoidia bacterium]
MNGALPDAGLRFETRRESPLDFSAHPKTRGWQYSLQIIPGSDGKHLGFIGARDLPAPDGDFERRLFIAESTDLVNWTNIKIALEPSDVPGTYGAAHIADPFVMEIDGRTYIWFAGINEAVQWQVGCAVSTDGFNTVEVTETPVIPLSFGGADKDTVRLTDDFSGVYEDGRILFVYNRGGGNYYGFAGVCDGDPMDPASYEPIGAIQFDKYPMPDWNAGNMTVYRADEGYYMLRATGVADAQDISVYVSDDFVNWRFEDVLLRGGPSGSWNNSVYKAFLLRTGDTWHCSFSGTETPMWLRGGPATGSNKTFRCGLATAAPQ